MEFKWEFWSNSIGGGLKGRRLSAPPTQSQTPEVEVKARASPGAHTRYKFSFLLFTTSNISQVTAITDTYGAQAFTCEVELDVLPPV